METAKVDVRKLQLFNDRINLCLDALDQVRSSVQGLSHSPESARVGSTATAAGFLDPRYTDPRLTDTRFGYGFTPAVSGYGNGLAHSSLPQIPFAGYAPAGFGAGGSLASQIPIGIWNVPFGLSHTPIETNPAYNRPVWADPLLAVRMAQTVPFVQFALPPVVPVY